VWLIIFLIFLSKFTFFRLPGNSAQKYKKFTILLFYMHNFMFHFVKKMHLLRFFVKILRFFLDNYFSLFTQKPHPILCFFLNKKNKKYLFLTLFIPFYNLFATSITSSPFASSSFAFVSRHCFTLKITISSFILYIFLFTPFYSKKMQFLLS